MNEKAGYTTPTAFTFTAESSRTVILTYTKITILRYGFRREKNNSDPDTRITYLYDAVGMTPMSVNVSGNHGPNWGSWKAFVYEVATPVMLRTNGTVAYELNTEDQTKKKDGTASDISNTAFDGNAMVRFNGKWKWVRRYEDANYEYVIFATGQYDSSYHALCSYGIRWSCQR